MADAEPEIRYLGDLQRLSLKPGDRLVLTVKGQLSRAATERLSACLKERIPGHEVIVLEEGMTLGAVGAEA